MMSIMTYDLRIKVELKVEYFLNVKCSTFIFFRIVKMFGIDSALAKILNRYILMKLEKMMSQGQMVEAPEKK